MSNSKLSNAVIVFVSPDAQRTANYYREVLGFRVVEHFDKAEKFAALYRDAIEIIVVQSKYGQKLQAHRASRLMDVMNLCSKILMGEGSELAGSNMTGYFSGMWVKSKNPSGETGPLGVRLVHNATVATFLGKIRGDDGVGNSVFWRYRA